MALSAQVSLSILAHETSSGDLSRTLRATPATYSVVLSDGTAAYQAQVVWSDARTLAGSSETLNLASLADTRDGASVTVTLTAVKAAYTAPYDTPANRIATLRFVQDIPLQAGEPGFDLVKEVGDGLAARFARTPTLICWGAQDWVFDDHFLRVWREKLPHAEVHRWVELLGLKREAVMPKYGKGGETYIQFAWVADAGPVGAGK